MIIAVLVLLYTYMQTKPHKSFLLTVFVVVPMLALDVMKLKTEIDENGIRINFFPLTKKQFLWADIESAEIIDYGFVGGWGIRMWTKFGTVYNTQGCEGVWLKLNTGKKVLIGTQRKQDLQNALDTYFA